MATKARAWCFTLNNPSEAADSQIKALVTNGTATYACWEHETAPTTGTKHIQGYIYFQNPRCLSGITKLIPGAHLEKAKGNAAQNKAYCHKEETVHFEVGTMPTAGKRTDIDVIKEMVKENKPMPEILEAATSYQSMKAAECLMKYKKIEERVPPIVKWYWGPTGTGKTRKAIEEAGEDVWISGRDLKWWNGYFGQRNVIIDDFRGDFCTFHELLRILDRYPYTVEVKGGSQPLRATQIVVTSALHPKEVYKGKTAEDINQLLRRIHEIHKFPLEQRLGTEVEGNTGTSTSGIEIRGICMRGGKVIDCSSTRDRIAGK